MTRNAASLVLAIGAAVLAWGLSDWTISRTGAWRYDGWSQVRIALGVGLALFGLIHWRR